MTRDLLVCGTRSFAVEVADLAEQVPGWRVAGFVENWERERAGQELEGLPIVWVDELAGRSGVWAICALVTTRRFLFTEQVEALGVPFATLVHGAAHVSGRSSLGEGTWVSAGSVVGARTTIGRHAILNRGALVGHHTEVGDHCSLMPGANVAGNVRLGERCFVGMGAVVRDNVTVGARAVIGAGAVVVGDVPAGVRVLGVPARVVGEAPDGH
jgi:acetyltransferase EpsM